MEKLLKELKKDITALLRDSDPANKYLSDEGKQLVEKIYSMQCEGVIALIFLTLHEVMNDKDPTNAFIDLMQFEKLAKRQAAEIMGAVDADKLKFLIKLLNLVK